MRSDDGLGTLHTKRLTSSTLASPFLLTPLNIELSLPTLSEPGLVTVLSWNSRPGSVHLFTYPNPNRTLASKPHTQPLRSLSRSSSLDPRPLCLVSSLVFSGMKTVMNCRSSVEASGSCYFL